MGMRHELHPLLSSSNFLFRPPPKHAIDKSRPKRHSNCPKCYSTFNKNWKLSARKTNKLSTRIFTHFLWILTKIQPNGTLRSTSRLFIKELENELTFDAKTFSISVTRTMDGGGENDYDYVAIGELDSYEFFSDFSPLKWLLENSKLWVATYISSKKVKQMSGTFLLCLQKKIFVKIEVDFVAKNILNICISNDPRTLKIAKVSCQNPMSEKIQGNLNFLLDNCKWKNGNF